MGNAEIPAVPQNPSLRLARAVLLLVSGAAAHVWLGGGLMPPVTSPSVVLPPAALEQRTVVGSTGSAAGVLAVATTLGHVAAAGRSAELGGDGADTPRVRPVERRRGPRFVKARTSVLAAAEPPSPVLRESVAPPMIPDGPMITDAPPSAGRPLAMLAVASPVLPPPAALPGASIREPEHPEAAAPLSDEMLVSHVLQQYRVAYEQLDVVAAKHIWPSVDARALGSAFSQLAEQRLTFQSCGVSVSGSGAEATARCRGRAEYVPKVGSRRARVANAEWVFDLAKQDADWRIVSANAIVK